MEKKEIEQIKKVLVKAKEELEKTLSQIAEKDPELKENWDARYPDVGLEGSEDLAEDSALARTIYEENIGVEQILELKLKKVNKALEKIDNGNYGLCENCGEKISEQRLKAVPEAELCQKCLKG